MRGLDVRAEVDNYYPLVSREHIESAPDLHLRITYTLCNALEVLRELRRSDVSAIIQNRASDQARIRAAEDAAAQAVGEAQQLRRLVELLNARIDLLRAPSANKVIVRDGDGRIRAIKDEACAG